LVDKHVLVTGAARGLGRAIAEAFADAGARVLATDRDEDGLAGMASVLGARGQTAQHDVTDPDAWSAIAEQARAAGGMDVLVNNAGTGALGSIETHTAKAWRTVFAVNTEGPFLGIQACLPLLRERRGAIVNIASCAAVEASPDLLAYGASKAALVQLTQSVAVHCARHGYGVRCNAVLPGPTLTEMMATNLDKAPDRAAAEAAWLSAVPLGRFADPAEVARAVCYLASPQASYITGAALPVDGGQLAQ
jgi:NAD(P)-dependent dehydrogenase (short-subunit alcohol dehydrogenase family)